MLYVYKGFLRENGRSEKLCLFNEEEKTAEFFKKEKDLIQFIIENYCSEYNNLKNDWQPWIQRILKGKFDFEITKRLAPAEVERLIDRTKSVLY